MCAAKDFWQIQSANDTSLKNKNKKIKVIIIRPIGLKDINTCSFIITMSVQFGSNGGTCAAANMFIVTLKLIQIM